MDAVAVLVALFQVVIAFAVRVGSTHLIAKPLVYGEHSIRIAVKIYLVEIAYQILVWISVAMMFYGFGLISPLIGGLLAGLTGLVLGLWVVYRMMKYTAKSYETNFFEGAVIYILSSILAAMVGASISFIAAAL